MIAFIIAGSKILITRTVGKGDGYV
jgi:hypothetical protein